MKLFLVFLLVSFPWYSSCHRYYLYPPEDLTCASASSFAFSTPESIQGFHCLTAGDGAYSLSSYCSNQGGNTEWIMTEYANPSCSIQGDYHEKLHYSSSSNGCGSTYRLSHDGSKTILNNLKLDCSSIPALGTIQPFVDSTCTQRNNPFSIFSETGGTSDFDLFTPNTCSPIGSSAVKINCDDKDSIQIQYSATLTCESFYGYGEGKENECILIKNKLDNSTVGAFQVNCPKPTDVLAIVIPIIIIVIVASALIQAGQVYQSQMNNLNELHNIRKVLPQDFHTDQLKVNNLQNTQTTHTTENILKTTENREIQVNKSTNIEQKVVDQQSLNSPEATLSDSSASAPIALAKAETQPEQTISVACDTFKVSFYNISLPLWLSVLTYLMYPYSYITEAIPLIGFFNPIQPILQYYERRYTIPQLVLSNQQIFTCPLRTYYKLRMFNSFLALLTFGLSSIVTNKYENSFLDKQIISNDEKKVSNYYYYRSSTPTFKLWFKYVYYYQWKFWSLQSVEYWFKCEADKLAKIKFNQYKLQFQANVLTEEFYQQFKVYKTQHTWHGLKFWKNCNEFLDKQLEIVESYD
jgi:hypothetical protein